MKTVEELFNDYKKVCEEYSIEVNDKIKDIINAKVEQIELKKQDLFLIARTAVVYTDKIYPDCLGMIKVNAIIKKYDKVHIHLLVIWDKFKKNDYMIYPLKQL
jgi:hypothetical protein